MTITERMSAESQVETLLSSIGAYLETNICDSLLMLHGGSPETLGTMELELLRDDLITVENDK